MKKLFTLALALSVAVAGYSQVKSFSSKDNMRKAATMQKAPRLDNMNVNANAESEPNMTRVDYGEGDLDYTYYDWQSNQGPRTWTINWPDGKVSFGYTYASDANYSDRGTGIGTYDPSTDEWYGSEGRIEAERTGFGSIARYKDNGIVVAAHTSSDLGVYIVENKDNLVPNSVPAALYTNNGSYTHPAVMTSGANRDIIHVFAGNFDDSTLPPLYWRSTDGQNWDKSEVILPFIEEYGADWGTNDYYWMETTDDNCLALVINSAWSDGMVLYSYDNGETWERKVFYHHPGVHNTYTTEHVAFLYPRWTSCVWGVNGELCMVYEFNGTNDHAGGEGGYYGGIGGVAFWSETMPYRGTQPLYGVDPSNPVPPTPGQPFIMDSAYIMEDVYLSWPLFQEQTHDMFNEYIGYLPALDEGGNVQDWDEVTEFNIEDMGAHGAYNCGPVAMPVICKLPGSDYDMVAVWSAMDEQTQPDGANHWFKLFASYSGDGGKTWCNQVHVTNDFMMTYTEHVYTQATVIGQTLVIACQADGGSGTSVMEDDPDPTDNLYKGYTFDLKDLFPDAGVGVPEYEHNNQISVYPNPAVDQLSVTLNKDAEMTVYNIMGQAVMTVEGRTGVNNIDITSLTSGIYFISAGTDTQKFIVK